jgi:hypothetical protein
MLNGFLTTDKATLSCHTFEKNQRPSGETKRTRQGQFMPRDPPGAILQEEPHLHPQSLQGRHHQRQLDCEDPRKFLMQC